MNEQAANISMRPARGEDDEFLYELYAGSRAEEVAAWGLDPAQRDMLLKLQFKASRQHYEIAFPGSEHSIITDQGRPVGRLLVYRSEQEIRLVDIALLPGHRGRGVGSALILELLGEAARSSRPLTLHVEKQNRAARLYERMGFCLAGETGAHFRMEWRPMA